MLSISIKLLSKNKKKNCKHVMCESHVFIYIYIYCTVDTSIAERPLSTEIPPIMICMFYVIVWHFWFELVFKMKHFFIFVHTILNAKHHGAFQCDSPIYISLVVPVVLRYIKLYQHRHASHVLLIQPLLVCIFMCKLSVCIPCENMCIIWHNIYTANIILEISWQQRFPYLLP